MPHYSTAPRRGYVIVHHTGSPNAHLNTTTDFCTSGYDFFVRYNGQIIVCSRWPNSTGAAARGCNCIGESIMLTGCFGGCASGNLSAPSYSQECSLAFLISHLGTPVGTDRIRPHRRCYYWNPCNEGPTGTVCPGTNLTTTSGTTKWSSAGTEFVNRVNTWRQNEDECGTCNHPRGCSP
jgi:hypothetical protein